jgi:hypothetical protein
VILTAEQVAEGWPGKRNTTPELFIELNGDNVSAKLAAMRAHGSQDRPKPSERSGTALTALMRLRGAQAGCEFAEAFGVLRWLIRRYW